MSTAGALSSVRWSVVFAVDFHARSSCDDQDARRRGGAAQESPTSAPTSGPAPRGSPKYFEEFTTVGGTGGDSHAVHGSRPRRRAETRAARLRGAPAHASSFAGLVSLEPAAAALAGLAHPRFAPWPDRRTRHDHARRRRMHRRLMDQAPDQVTKSTMDLQITAAGRYSWASNPQRRDRRCRLPALSEASAPFRLDLCARRRSNRTRPSSIARAR